MYHSLSYTDVMPC